MPINSNGNIRNVEREANTAMATTSPERIP